MLEFFKRVVEWIRVRFDELTIDQIDTYVTTAVNISNEIKAAVNNNSDAPQIAFDLIPIVEDAIEKLGFINKGTLETVNGLINPLINITRTASKQHQNMIYHKLASNITVGLSNGELSEHQADTLAQMHYATTKEQ